MTNQQSPAVARERNAREFAFSDTDFDVLRSLVKEKTGINLGDAKRELVYGRLSRRLRALGLESFLAYREVLTSGDSQEMVEFCNALTTNLTSFFRESHHFDYLREQLLLPALANRHATPRLRIWSSACSTGEEPYSIAMTILESIPDCHRWDIKVLATDLDSDVVAHARRGLYAADRVSTLDARRVAKYFQVQSQGPSTLYQVVPEVARLVTFKNLNLMHPLPMSGPLDAIFCRNVVIYFDKDTQRGLFARMALLQRPGDLLFLGHSESLFKVCDDYSLVGKTIYRRT